MIEEDRGHSIEQDEGHQDQSEVHVRAAEDLEREVLALLLPSLLAGRDPRFPAIGPRICGDLPGFKLRLGRDQ